MSAMVAGGDIKPGRVYGQSDATASSPVDFGTHPTDVLATIYHMLGISPETIIYNHLNQPGELSKVRSSPACSKGEPADTKSAKRDKRTLLHPAGGFSS
jgi:hypothetical protein